MDFLALSVIFLKQRKTEYYKQIQYVEFALSYLLILSK